MLESIIYSNNGDAYLNSLRRFAFSDMLTPKQSLMIAKCPPASSATSPGLSQLIPYQGPEDAKSELYSMIGGQGIPNVGMGSVSTDGVTAILTGVGSEFTNQVIAGDTIKLPQGSFTVLSIQSNTSLTLTAVPLVSSNTAYVILTPIVADAQNKLFVKIQDPAWRRYLMNRDVPAAHVWGSSQKPLYMKESLLLETDQTLLVQYYNYSTAASSSFGGLIENRKWQQEALRRPAVRTFIEGLRKRKKWVQPYWLTLDDGIVTIPAGSSVTKFFTCTGDISLVLFYLYGYAVSSGVAGDIKEKVALQFFDAKTERALQIQETTINTACGTAENPFRLPAPLIVEPQTQIKVKMRNLVTDAPTDVYMTFHGVALYTGSTYGGGALTDPAIQRESQKIYRATKPELIPASPQG